MSSLNQVGSQSNLINTHLLNTNDALAFRNSQPKPHALNAADSRTSSAAAAASSSSAAAAASAPRVIQKAVSLSETSKKDFHTFLESSSAKINVQLNAQKELLAQEHAAHVLATNESLEAKKVLTANLQQLVTTTQKALEDRNISVNATIEKTHLELQDVSKNEELLKTKIKSSMEHLTSFESALKQNKDSYNTNMTRLGNAADEETLNEQQREFSTYMENARRFMKNKNELLSNLQAFDLEQASMTACKNELSNKLTEAKAEHETVLQHLQKCAQDIATEKKRISAIDQELQSRDVQFATSIGPINVTINTLESEIKRINNDKLALTQLLSSANKLEKSKIFTNNFEPSSAAFVSAHSPLLNRGAPASMPAAATTEGLAVSSAETPAPRHPIPKRKEHPTTPTTTKSLSSPPFPAAAASVTNKKPMLRKISEENRTSPPALLIPGAPAGRSIFNITPVMIPSAAYPAASPVAATPTTRTPSLAIRKEFPTPPPASRNMLSPQFAAAASSPVGNKPNIVRESSETPLTPLILEKNSEKLRPIQMNPQCNMIFDSAYHKFLSQPDLTCGSLRNYLANMLSSSSSAAAAAAASSVIVKQDDVKERGYTGLHVLLLKGHSASVILTYLKYVKYDNSTTPDGWDPIHLIGCSEQLNKAPKAQLAELFKLLQANQVIFSSKNSQGVACSHIAAHKNHTNILEALLPFNNNRHDDFINARDSQGFAPIHYAILSCRGASQHNALTQLVNSRDVDVNKRLGFGDWPSPLMMIVQGELTKAANYLLSTRSEGKFAIELLQEDRSGYEAINFTFRTQDDLNLFGEQCSLNKLKEIKKILISNGASSNAANNSDVEME